MNATLSRRPLRRFWGWGYDDAALSEGERTQLDRLLKVAGMPQSGRITLAIRPERISLTDSGNLAGEVEEVLRAASLYGEHLAA